MDKQKYFELLKIGLTEGEAKVYLALMELGSSTVGPIVKKARVAYSNVYDILNRLIEKGVVSFVLKSKTKYFQAVTPRNLLEYLDKKEAEIIKQKKELAEAMPSLEKLQEFKPMQEAEIFLGIKGLRAAYEKLLSGMEEGDEDLFFYIDDKEYSKKADLFYFSITDLLYSHKARGICNEGYRPSPFVKSAKEGNVMKLRFVDFPTPGNVETCRDKVLIVSWKDEVTGFLLHSKSVAEHFRKYFESVWAIAKE